MSYAYEVSKQVDWDIKTGNNLTLFKNLYFYNICRAQAIGKSRIRLPKDLGEAHFPPGSRIRTQGNSSYIRKYESLNNNYGNSRIGEPIINKKTLKYNPSFNQVDINNNVNQQDHQNSGNHHVLHHGDSLGKGRGPAGNVARQTSSGRINVKGQQIYMQYRHRYYRTCDCDHDGECGGLLGNGDQISNQFSKVLEVEHKHQRSTAYYN